MWYSNRPDGTSSKTFASGAGGMGFKSRADQVSHTLPTTRHRCNLDVWALAQSRGDGHRSPLVTPERVLSEYNEDLIFCGIRKMLKHQNIVHITSAFFSFRYK